MHMPIQCEPVQRTLAPQQAARHAADFAHRDADGGVVPSQYGVEANGWFDKILQTAVPIVQSLLG